MGMMKEFEHRVCLFHAALRCKHCDAKYSSLEPIFKKMEERLASVKAPQMEKSDFLNGFDGSLSRSMEPRNALMRHEKEWMDASVELYDFMLANSDHYSIRDKKLYFDKLPCWMISIGDSPRPSDFTRILRKQRPILTTAGEQLETTGVSPSEFAPSQLGKLH